MAEKVHLFVCNELNRIQKRPNTWNTNSIIFVQYFTFLAVKQLNKYPRPAIYSREPPAKLLWIRIRQSIVRLLHVLSYLRGPLQTSTYKLCIYQRSYVSYRQMEVDPMSIIQQKSPHQISTIVRFLLVNRSQSTNQISLEGLLLTVSVISNDLLQSTTIKHRRCSRIIQLY